MVHAYPARQARLVYTLCVDLIGSTAGAIAMTQRETDRFNRALVNQIEPHLSALGFDELSVKFTGDGWLLTSPEIQDAERLCALASILQSDFHAEMRERAALAPSRIPEQMASRSSGFSSSARLIS